jgi:hypothetical protein
MLDGGRAVALGERPLSLRHVRGFRIRGPRSGYDVILLRRARGTVRAVQTLPERANPEPGPTVELALASGPRFRHVRVDARIVPRQ